MSKRYTRIYFATDVHGSETCFRKFLGAAKFYKADVLVLGGDITGKVLVPITDEGEIHRAEFLGKEIIAKTNEELRGLEDLIAAGGYYSRRMNRSEAENLQNSKEKLDQIFLDAMKERLMKWVSLAEESLSDTDVMCYISGGNDDFQEVVDEVKDGSHVRNADNKVIAIDPNHEMVCLGWSNPTPWNCPRDHSEQEIASTLEKLMSSVSNSGNCVFNLHTPPKDSELDLVPKLDSSVSPPKPVFEKGQQIWVCVGSESVRLAVEKYQPLLHLCGHIHEARGTCRIKKTLVINPGSEYTEGILRGVIVNLAEDKVLSWQLTSG